MCTARAAPIMVPQGPSGFWLPRAAEAPRAHGGIRDASSFNQGRHPRYGEFCRPWPLEPYCFLAAETVADPGGVVPVVRGRALPFDDDLDGDIMPLVGEAADD